MKKLVICGASGAGCETLELIEALNTGSRWDNVGFSEVTATQGQTLLGYYVMSDDDLLSRAEPIDAVISVGFPELRKRIYGKLSQNPNIHFPPIVHPSSYVSRRANLSDAVLIGAFCGVSPDAVLGRGVFLNGRVGIGHDSTVGDFSVIMPGSSISGNVNIGDNVLIGAGSVVVPGLNIGNNAVICAGSVVLRDVKDGSKVIGNPAKAIG
ncbi:acetyltransferase [Synergistales bacterium]|nr:acetyltransferase [Synergistales bacterium]